MELIAAAVVITALLALALVLWAACTVSGRDADQEESE